MIHIDCYSILGPTNYVVTDIFVSYVLKIR